jgi:FlaA1/EpsC-like NDP-sugar epimerase
MYSEKIHLLMRMIDVNIFNTENITQSIENGTKKYFCVSTDKAANPVNMMGTSKRIMEIFDAKKLNKLQFRLLDLRMWPFQTVLYCMVSTNVF